MNEGHLSVRAGTRMGVDEQRLRRGRQLQVTDSPSQIPALLREAGVR